MRLLMVFITILLSACSLSAQWLRSSLAADGTIQVSRVADPVGGTARNDGDTLQQITGFPKGFPANPTFKNFRNLSLADLDRDGTQEIITGINDQLYVLKNNQLLWQKQLEGVAVYPPSVADVDNDGAPEIALVTAGTGKTAAYLLEADGTDFPNWPLDFSDHWLLTAPTLVDLDDDGNMEIIILERITPNGDVHIQKLDGSSFSSDWPVAVEATPAVTPSVGDVDNDGEAEIVLNTTQARYILSLDGLPEMNFPIVTHPRQRYSYQSPILVDLDGDGDLEVVGLTHSDANVDLPVFYVMEHDGTDYPGWPIPIPKPQIEQLYSYNTPTVVYLDGAFRIFMSRPIGTEVDDMLYGWDKDGNMLPGFPIVKSGGLEGIISVADVDGDGAPELVFGSNLIDPEGYSHIHAYEMDGTGEVPGFPLKLYGWNYLNGAALGDVDGNDTLDLVALSYTQTFGQGKDSTFVNVFNLGVPYDPATILWGTYKGDNSRQGLVTNPMVSTATILDLEALKAKIYPNPADKLSRLRLVLSNPAKVQLELLDATGKKLRTLYTGQRPAGEWQLDIRLADLAAGVYYLHLQAEGQRALIPINKL
ncbi:MAG: T9SS type A sorting domain-containing protein [Saprospiraceae bacterium]|nr:T9SS type A sorting domain-containing protein [Lewinella sp.]